MIKRIIAIISTILILAVFTLSTFANVDKDELHNHFNKIESEYSVGPITDFTTRYKLVVNPYNETNQFRGYTDYNIYDILQSGVGLIQQEYRQQIGLIQHFFPDYTDGNLTNSITITLADGTLLSLTVEGDMVYGIFTVYNTQGTLIRYAMLFDPISQDNDIALYMNYDGILNIMEYNKYDGTVISSRTLNIQMYGIVYPQDVFPFANAFEIEEARKQSFELGKQEGLAIGSEIKREQLQAEYDRGHDIGYRVGFDEGEDKGYLTGLRENSKAAYNQGKIDGENISKSLDNMFTDLFSGLGDFFGNFMQLGVGPLTMFNLLSVIVTAFLVITLAKVIRG